MNRTFLFGLLCGLTAAAAFGSSGPLAKGLLATGWTPAGAVIWRVAIGALALLPFGILSLRGRWHTARKGWRRMLLFGLLGVAVCQLAYFLAIQTLSVAVGLLLEYLGIVMVVMWLWARRGQKPRPLTIAGSVLAIGGLVLVLDVFGVGGIDLVGALWALLAAVGLACYFLVAADTEDGLPGIALASGGLIAGTGVLGLAAVIGIVPFNWNTAPVELGGAIVPWWLAVGALGLVAAALAYAAGVLGSRRLGSKLASFVGLTEVLFAVVWAFLLLGEMPGAMQLAGGTLIFAGVVLVKLDEPRAVGPVAVAELEAA